MTTPQVSVIIPTLRRPRLLLRALRSVLAQTMATLEVIIVVDGQDPETIIALHEIKDKRIHIVQNEASLGPGASRNVGISRSTAPWVAFLDDDDEWLSEKLERQLLTAQGHATPIIIASLYYASTPHARFVWPLRIYDNIIPFDEYLFDRKTFTKGESLLHLSSIMVSRDVFDHVIFPDLRMYEDYVFQLQAVKVAKAKVVTVREPLTIVYLEEQRPSLSAASSWRASLNWIDTVAPLIGPKAYMGFCLTTIGPQAAAIGDYSAFFSILRQVFSRGRPRLIQIYFFLCVWIFPIGLRRRLRGLLPSVRSSNVS